ncbi:MAG: InlB B-repeat-containing protein [Ruminococcus sp.]|jgi:hypothetical protein|nr:InlB B-repeat-containing protein [Ruminococcus sp.]
MGNYKVPIIAAAVAVIAVVVTIIILTSGTESGLYVENIQGSVSVTGESGDGPASAELRLSDRDIITVLEDSSCTLVYKGKDNDEKNYIILGANSQAVVSGKFSGTSAGELFLNRGTAVCNLAGESKGTIAIRTSNAMAYVQNTVSIVSNYQSDSKYYTDIFDFMGNSKLALYDESGNQVNDLELLLEKRAASIVTADRGPFFDYLNQEFSLSVLSANELRHIITIAQTIGTDFPYSVTDLAAALESAPSESTAPTQTTPVTSEPIETASPIDTTLPPPDVTTAPPNTNITLPPVTAAPPRTSATTAAPTVTTPPSTPSDGFVMPSEEPNSDPITVILQIGDDEELFTVQYGGSIPRPADPVVPGYVFGGWSSSFENITADKTISAILTPIGGSATTLYPPSTTAPAGYHTVTIIIADKTTRIQVPHGGSAGLSDNISLDGYRFIAWDRDYRNITEDCTIRAILEPIAASSHTVTFMINGAAYPISVQHGGTAVPPYYPQDDGRGNAFLGWDRDLNNITADVTITAVYDSSLTVTFVVDGNSYQVKVERGGTAVPNYIPTYDSYGNPFIGWDRALSNIQTNTTITALFASTPR